MSTLSRNAFNCHEILLLSIIWPTLSVPIEHPALPAVPEPAGLPGLEGGEAFITGICPRDQAAALSASQLLRQRILSQVEAEHYRTLRTDKRRLDWLAGRAAAKAALRLYFRKTLGHDLDPATLEVAANAQGGPVCSRPDAPAFSISHCAAGGLCVAGFSGRLIGADWETVTPRTRGLARLFTREGELPVDREASPLELTRLWAVKEAVLKLLGLGLACSPRDVEAVLALGAQPIRFHGAARARWESLGSPRVSIAMTDDTDSVAAVAYTGD